MLFVRAAAFAAIAAAVNAAPVVEERQLFAAPSAQIKNGTVVGSTDYLNQVDNFMGIPFALQPTSTRRLANPTSMSAFGGTFTATGTPMGCPGFVVSQQTQTGAAQAAIATGALVGLNQATNTGEACLNLNVQRTQGIKPGQKVPVLVYIYGGGFSLGTTSMYDGTPLIKKAQSLGLPLVYVAMSYRLAALGFMPGKEMAGNANLGLKDQRLALKWVAENIAAFGGDPAKVTIWGESAGAISVFDQIIAEGGNINYNGKPLFVGGIMNSGSAVPALPISAPINQAIYDQVVYAAGCKGTADTLACLRSVSTETIQTAQATVPGIFNYQSLHLAYFPRPDPSDNFYPVSPEQVASAGAFAKVPIIIGDQEDEGTLFAQVQSNITTNDQLVKYLQSYVPGGEAAMATLVNSYPQDQASGSPFRTGDNWALYPQYKRLAAILGDIVFTLTRRVYLSYAVSNGITAWSYMNTYLQNTGPLGTFHGSDILNDRTVALSATAQNATQTYYLSFTYYQDPNKITPAVHWPKYDATNRQILNFTQNEILVQGDFFREAQYQILRSVANQLRA